MSIAHKNRPSPIQLVLYDFIKGGLIDCIATTTVFPLDVLKTWMQTKNEQRPAKIRLREGISYLYKQKGIKTFYTGLPATLLRQFRLGTYFIIVDYIKHKEHRQPSITEKLSASMAMSIIGSLAFNSFETILVRMWCDLGIPPEQRKSYTNIHYGFYRIIKEEGFKSLWKETTSKLMRAFILNMRMMVPYMEFNK